MKALKTVAVALGITLAALIVIPLAVLAGLFVWLKLTEEADEEILELEQRRRLIEPTGPVADDATAGSPTQRDGRPPANRRASDLSAGECHGPAFRRGRPTVGIMVLWAGNFIVVKGAVTLIPPVAFAFIRFGLAASCCCSCCAGGRVPPAAAAATPSSCSRSGRSGSASTRSCGRPGSPRSPRGTRRCSSRPRRS